MAEGAVVLVAAAEALPRLLLLLRVWILRRSLRAVVQRHLLLQQVAAAVPPVLAALAEINPRFPRQVQPGEEASLLLGILLRKKNGGVVSRLDSIRAAASRPAAILCSRVSSTD